MTASTTHRLQTFERLRWIHHARRAVFRVETPTQGTVFMSMRESDLYSIVEVDATRLLNLWRHPETELSGLAYGTPASWREDRKFGDAQDGFDDGESNPVPLALVTCRRRSRIDRQPGLAESARQAAFEFTNGVTRTMWPLANGARVFPMSCGIAEAPLLYEMAGAAAGGHCRVDELVLHYRSDDERFAELEASNAMVLQANEERDRRRRGL
nr:hypothetical protein [uncultured Ralstonia sp.]